MESPLNNKLVASISTALPAAALPSKASITLFGVLNTFVVRKIGLRILRATFSS
ncbi:hypothetical protein D9M69_446540 [compost metagenome]